MTKILEFIFNLFFGTTRTAKKISGWYKNKYSNQVQAKINPHTSCAAHAGAFFLQNINNDYFKNYTPDDYSRDINSKKYLIWTRKNLNAWTAAKYKGNLNQVWKVQRKFIQDKLNESGDSKWLVIFNETTKTDTIKLALKNSPVIINTNPTYKGVKIGHVTLVVDYKEEHHIFIMDDSFGDITKNYKTGHIDKGDDVIIDKNLFEKVKGSFAIYLK